MQTIDKVTQDSLFDRKWGVIFANSLAKISRFATIRFARKPDALACTPLPAFFGSKRLRLQVSLANAIR